jgi:hypothetical protein
MTKIKCIKEYPVMLASIKVGTILTEIPSVMGSTSYKDEEENVYNFDSSEVIFSSDFRDSFVVVK